VVAAEPDLATTLAGFPPDVREEVLLTADEAVLRQLPPALLAEASVRPRGAPPTPRGPGRVQRSGSARCSVRPPGAHQAAQWPAVQARRLCKAAALAAWFH